MSWMFHITGCVVQAAVAKAKKVSDEKQKALEHARKDELEKKKKDEEDASDDDDDEPMVDVAKKKKEKEAREARKANQELRAKEARQALVKAARNSTRVVVPEKSPVKPTSRSSRRSILNPPRNQVTEQPSPEPVVF